MTKVLIGIPYHPAKRYSLGLLMDWLESADLGDAEVIMRWHRGTFGEKDAVKQQREFFRNHALIHEFTHLYFLGADTIPPLDVIPKLLAHDKDVAGALYNSRNHGTRLTPLAWRDSGDPYGCLKEQGLVEVDAMGMDAVMFSANALRDFSFTSYERNDDDWPVYRILTGKGHKIYVDTTLVCKHYQTDKDFF